MGRLDEYRRKRDFDRTSEPAGGGSDERGAAARDAGAGADAGGRRYVMHKHAARQLHYDLRLEHEGVLLSWALPKGPSLEPGEKRLAVHVEDHPLSYGDFEGTIPAGEYGGGTVMLWDRGVWAPIGEGLREGRIDFELRGEKLRGAWTLTRSGGRRGADGKDWLLIKRSDPGAEPLEPHDASVLSGRTMEQIAAGTDPVAEEGATATAFDPGTLDGARPAPLGPGAEPQLASLVGEAPAGADWIHEIKFDGYRVVARLEGGEARLFTRNGHDWTERFGEIAADLARLPVRAALIDGEVVAIDAEGRSSFRALQEALSGGATAALRYQAFDLLHLNGHDLRGVAQIERKRTLAAVLAGAETGGGVRYTDHVAGKGPAFFARACEMGLEGIISKRADAPYRGGRGTRWRKVKCERRDAFVVGGYTAPKGSRAGFGALLLGAFAGASLAYAGRVGTGFDDRRLRRLHAALRQIERPTPPFAEVPRDVRDATWVEPEVVVEVAFTERTRDGRLRHPTFRGLREDKSASEVSWPPADAAAGGVATGGSATEAEETETPEQPATKVPRTATASDGGNPPPKRRSARARKGDAEVVGVRLSNPDRVLYPAQGITKLALAEYYVAIEAQVLPGMAERPLALVRCPQGRAKTCFYQKHPGDAFPRDLPLVPIEESSGVKHYAYVRTIADLVGLVQAGVLEVHVWGSRIDDVERPDLMVIDLDPWPDVPWATTREAARTLRARLEDLGLAGFLRTTGGKGLHVVVPLRREHGWDEVKSFARALCERIAEADRERLTTSASKAKRPGKIYLDFLRNGRGATAIGSYSTRAREGAPVAVPVRWDELDGGLRPDRYTVGNVRRRLASLRGDPWEGFDAAAGRITAAMRKEVGLR
jgi:bifunctional non-homologous end joining protein LigD